MTTFIIPPNKRRIAVRFDRAAETYDSGAAVQREITQNLACLIKNNIDRGQIWCDIGSATGALAEHLMPLPQGTKFICLDIAYALLRRANLRGADIFALNGDIDFPPIRDMSLDGAVMASMLQWVSSPQITLCKISKLLKPNGVLYFAVFTEDAFKEITAVRAKMGLPQIVWLPSQSSLFSMLESAGFHILQESVLQFNRTLQFTDAISALKSIGNIGASAASGKLLNRKELDEFCRDYTAMFSEAGTVGLTYRSVIGMARKKVD